jgi:hypothetical protein
MFLESAANDVGVLVLRNGCRHDVEKVVELASMLNQEVTL